MIDWARARRLRDEVGSDDFGDVVELFLEEVDAVVGRLRAGADPARLESDLHFLKGSALNLGFAAFGALCHAGEQQAAAGEAAAVDVAGLVAVYDRSRAAFLAEAGDLLGRAAA